MKKTFSVIGCGVGGAMIGFFAGRLDTVAGIVLFALGVVILTASSYTLLKIANKCQASDVELQPLIFGENMKKV